MDNTEMITIDNLTLAIADCVNAKRAEDVIDICTKSIRFSCVKFFTSLETSSIYKIEIPRIKSLNEYSDFCLRDMVKYIDTTHILIVQHDGYIINPDRWDSAFMDYDYIGAPWERYKDKNVGNGGFSLRSRKLLQYMSDNFILERKHPHEDFEICLHRREELINNGFTFAPIDLAARFSVDCNFNFDYSKTFGFHRIEALRKIRELNNN